MLVIGTPCQIAGIKQYLVHRRLNCEHAIFCDLLCHGVQSPRLGQDYMTSIEEKYKRKISFITFKDKTLGWLNPQAFARMENKTITLLELKRVLFSDAVMRPACHSCTYKSTERVSDITIGDFWGVDKIYPSLYDRNGVSIVMINTEKGHNFFEEAKSELCWQEIRIQDCKQPSVLSSTPPTKWRKQFWKHYNKKLYYLM